MRWSALLVAAALAGCGPLGGPPDASVRPQPTPVGVPVSEPVSTSVSSAGGRLVSEDGLLVVEVPAGLFTASTELRVQTVTNTAPGGVGYAYRIQPEGTGFAAPVTVTLFAPQGRSVADLSVAFQEGQGYWLRVAQSDQLRDRTRQSITVRTRHFSGWTLVSGPTARDLQGTFTLDSSLDVPFAGATGTATFTWAGDDPGVSYYLLDGTITLPSPLPVGVDSCTPRAPEVPTLALRTNIAELRTTPAGFLWGLSGHWNLTCTGPGGTREELLLTAFDTQGISSPLCARGYDAGMPFVVGPDRVQGTYVIDCAAKGLAAASWSFASFACGAACTSPNPCRTAVNDCSSGTAVCTDTGVVPDGDTGGCPSPATCQGGVCFP